MQKVIVLVLIALGGVAVADRMPEPSSATPTMMAPRPPQRRPIPLQPPHPAPEIAQLAKQLAGSYTCKGVLLRGDGSSTPLEATVTIKLGLDGAWLVVSSLETKLGGTMFDEYRTYDGTAKQWTRIQLASTSAHVISTSLGERDGKWMWEGTATSPAGTMAVRDYEQLGSKQFKVWGEAMLSGRWQKSYEATCKR